MTATPAPTFTILLPIVRPPDLLPFAVRSVLAQDRQDFELFIVCDGAPPETVACAEAFAAEHRRIRVFAHPKGAGNGEAHRHRALGQARGIYVCQIGDDDLWLPHHLTEMAKLLETADFGNLSHFEIAGSGAEFLLAGDLGDSWIRHRMATAELNFFGASVSGYRLAAYRALPEGWAPGPPGRPSDFNMWLKFLRAPGLRFGTRVAVTTLKLGSSDRRGWSMDQRVQETAGWADRLADPLEREQIAQLGLRAMSRVAYHMEARAQDEKQCADALAEQLARTSAQLAARAHQVTVWRDRSKAMQHSWSWRLTKPFRELARLITGGKAR